MAYNGWSTYETWRINLEFGLSDGGYEEYDAEMLEEMVEEYIFEMSSGLARDYAMAFISDVDWDEIADNAKED
jgi:hypothetical protein